MRKSKLYASVALAALLAACSNEDFVSNEQQTSDLGRPTAKVALAFDEDAATRLEFQKPEGKGWQWTFADGDKIGALLMDEWNQKGTGIENYEITDYVHTNYPFIRQTVNGQTTWNTPEDAAVCEGNYFFYFPYDKTFTRRGLIGWSVNPDQRNYDPETGEYFAMQAIEDNQKWLGYKFIESTTDGINKVNFDFVPLFASPKFMFENRTSLNLQVERLVIRDNSNGTNTGVNPSGDSKLLATSMMLAPGTGKFEEVNQKWEANDFDWHTAQMWNHAQRYINEDFAYPSANEMKIIPNGKVYTLNNELADREATYEYTVDFGEKYIVNNGHDVVARLVMPGGLYQTGKVVFEALLYVKNPETGKRYVVRVDLGNPQTQGGTNTSAWDDIIGDKANHFLRPGYMATFVTSFDASALQSYEITDFKVATTGELKWLLEEIVENTGAKDLTVTTFGKNVKLNSEIAELLKANPQVRLSINGDITLTEDAPANAINLLYFYNPAIHTNLHIEGAQVADEWKWNDSSYNQDYDSKDLGNCTIEVTETGSLDTKKNGITIKADKLTNAGTVVAGEVASNVENSGKFTADVVEGNIENSGELVILEKVFGNIKNDGNAEIANVSGAVTNNNEMTLNGAVYAGQVSNEGIMTIAKASEFTFDGAALFNKATLNINADVTSGENSNFVNSGATVIAEGKTVKFAAITNSGEITVSADAVMTTNANKKDAITNAKGAVINNAGTVHNVANNGEIIVLDATSITNVTSGNGTINNTAMGDVTYNKDQTCVYVLEDASAITIAELGDNVKKADANRLEIMSGTLSWEDGLDFEFGSITNNERGYFGKGVRLHNVTLDGTMNKNLILYTDGLEITGTTSIEHGTVKVVKGLAKGTKAVVTGELNISNYGTFGGVSILSKLYIDFTEGEVHNQGTVEHIDNKNACQQEDDNHWTGNAAK